MLDNLTAQAAAKLPTKIHQDRITNTSSEKKETKALKVIIDA